MELIVELGFPELPSGTIAPAAEQLAQGLRAAAEAAGLLGPEARLRVYSTPRRLCACLTGILERQADSVQEVRGPSLAAAFAADGEPTKALLGFARGQGVAPEELERRETPQGQYVFARREVPGRSAREILREAVPEVARGLRFPRTMRWAAGAPRLPRPLGWLLALLDGEVVQTAIGPIEAGDLTYAHRVAAPGPHRVRGEAEYLEVLRAGLVEPDRGVRRRRIADGVRAAAAAEGLAPDLPEELLDEVTDLCEWPEAFVGGFRPEYLELPEDVLAATMIHHQRFFPLRGQDGRLRARFGSVRNGGEEAVVRHGNETVLAARLADALFFYREDLRRPLGDRREDLRGIAYAPDLGSLYERTERLADLGARIAEAAGRPDLVAALRRAGEIALCDRATALVRELPELEGTMGGVYARLSGESEGVARALAARVRPRGGDDQPPADDAGRLLALADRIDHLMGFLAAGRAPTGSQDPYGLRRAAIGALRIWEELPELPLAPVLDAAQAGLGPLLGEAAEAGPAAVRTFLAARLLARAQELGHDPRVGQAVLAAGAVAWPGDVLARVAAVETAAEMESWPRLVQAARRAKNLAQAGDVRGAEGPELALLQEIEALEAEGEALLARRDHLGYLRRAARLYEPLDRFFTDVMVMAEDPAVRGRRQALLDRAHRALGRVAEIAALGAAD